MGDIREPAAAPSLSTELNSSTRAIHAELNKLITARIALALPPHAKDPSLYTLGLSVFAEIFISLEETLDRLAERTARDQSEHQRAIIAWITGLKSHGIERTSRLRYDLRSLKAKFPPSRPAFALDRVQSTIERLERDRPHAFAAYMWVMYMAVFSGGRWIRRQLADAGPGFWPSPSTFASMGFFSDLSRPGYTFLSFDGDNDGDEIKAEFKAELAKGDALLTAAEREDVVDAASDLFRHCIEIVEALDEEVKARAAERRWVRLKSLAWLSAVVVAVYLVRSYWL